ncbi:hypothetical protein A11A3_09490 [Alcanivorax hongdengensis A-11-3]|uniref:Uncharacterized protein n=1 Tax=Alcanivorax hongdengensis A-11-3 TaxID=1177179 RepID=L0WDJ3_9GAMM|nr:hypothetical protein [Alcanivorax hongdengensis]EKF74222.1 hypothetical protein A11A3_09490 [Alcanivorax hongdengensis A-11-3]
MNEAQRQSYLKAMGLTPWVARVPLPGAAPSPALDWQEENPGEVPAQPAPESSMKPARPAAEPTRVESPAATPAPAKPSPDTPVEAEPAPQASAAVPAGQALTFTLEAHGGNGTWLLAAQQDAQAPGLGRFEAPLLASLLALFRARPERPRRFFCPLTDQPMAAGDAAQALDAFLKGLHRQAGGERVLLLLPQALSESLFEIPRYRPFTLGGMPALVVSSLTEMLEDPAEHKKTSWLAMQEHGFAGQ